MQSKPHVPNQRRARRAALSAGIALGVAALLGARPAAAQAARAFPESARLGRLRMRVFPEATLNDEPVRFGAGARIYNERNMIVMPATVSGDLDVLVERDPVGNIARAWILAPDELQAARERERTSGRDSAGGRTTGQGR